MRIGFRVEGGGRKKAPEVRCSEGLSIPSESGNGVGGTRPYRRGIRLGTAETGAKADILDPFQEDSPSIVGGMIF